MAGSPSWVRRFAPPCNSMAAASQADSDATGPSPGEATRACAARPRVRRDRRPPTDQTPATASGHALREACQLACVAARAACTRTSLRVELCQRFVQPEVLGQHPDAALEVGVRIAAEVAVFRRPGRDRSRRSARRTRRRRRVLRPATACRRGKTRVFAHRPSSTLPGSNCISSRRVSTFQRRTVWSLLPDARVRPSGENTTAWTALECPLSVSRSFPVATSHNCTFPRRLARARVLPSGEKATSSTLARVPDRHLRKCS